MNIFSTLQCGKAGDYIVEIGDGSTGKYRNTTSFFSLSEEKWLDQTIPAPNGFWVGWPTIVQLQDTFLVLGGGENSEEFASKTIYEFDVKAFSWIKRKEETAVATRAANVFSFEC